MKRASRCRAALLVLGLILSLGPAVFAQRCSGDPEFCRLITSAVDYQSIVVRNFTTSAIRAENRGTYNIGQVFDIWEVVTGAWDYRHDVLPSDHFRSASTSISTYNRWRQFRGDCEDYATVLAACIRAIGGTVWLRFERDEAKRESHVYTMVYLGGADWEAKLKPYIFDRYPQAEAVWFMSYTDGSRWLNLDWTAFHPGGEFLYSDRDYGIVGVGDVELPGGGRVAPGLPGGTALICSTLIVSPVSYWSVPASGGSLSVTVTAPAGCSWSVTNPFSSWVTVTPTSGTGTRTITVRVAPNTGAARYATITIAGKSFNVGQQVRSQSQGCISSITPQAYWSVPASGGSLSVTVTAPAGCSWSVTNFNSWITVTPTSGTGSQTITVRVAANFGAARYATITIGGKSFNVGQQRRV